MVGALLLATLSALITMGLNSHTKLAWAPYAKPFVPAMCTVRGTALKTEKNHVVERCDMCDGITEHNCGVTYGCYFYSVRPRWWVEVTLLSHFGSGSGLETRSRIVHRRPPHKPLPALAMHSPGSLHYPEIDKLEFTQKYGGCGGRVGWSANETTAWCANHLPEWSPILHEGRSYSCYAQLEKRDAAPSDAQLADADDVADTRPDIDPLVFFDVAPPASLVWETRAAQLLAAVIILPLSLLALLAIATCKGYVVWVREEGDLPMDRKEMSTGHYLGLVSGIPGTSDEEYGKLEMLEHDSSSDDDLFSEAAGGDDDDLPAHLKPPKELSRSISFANDSLAAQTARSTAVAHAAGGSGHGGGQLAGLNHDKFLGGLML